MLGWILSIQGGYGCGKNSLTKAVLHYKYGGYLSPVTMDIVNGKFRTWLKSSVVWVLDETTKPGPGMLKTLISKINEAITEDFISVEEKNKNVAKYRNWANGINLTNFREATLHGPGQRRVAPLYSAIQTEEQVNEAFNIKDWIEGFPDIYKAVKSDRRYKLDWWGCYKYWYEQAGGAEAVRYYFESVAVPAKPGWAPKTTVSEDAGLQGEDDWEKVIRDCIDEGELGFSGGFISMNAVKKVLEQSNRRYIPGDIDIGNFIQGLGMGYVKYRPALSSFEIQQFLPKHEGAKTKFALYCNVNEVNDKKGITPAKVRGYYEKHLRQMVDKASETESM
jgi:hypothetical protein